MDFQTHCKNRGIELLREDVSFVRDRLKCIPRVSHKSVLQKYADIWLKVMCECEDDRCGQNLGRRSANTFLREL